MGRWSRSSLLAVLLGCHGATDVAPIDAAADDLEDAGPEVPLEVPPLDPSKCPAPRDDAKTGFAKGSLPTHGALVDKALPVLALLDDLAVHADPAVSALATARDARLRDALSCVDAPCVAGKLVFSEVEAKDAAAALAKALPDPAKVANDLRKAGVAARFADAADAPFLIAAFGDALLAASAGFSRYASVEVAKVVATAVPAGKAKLHEPLTRAFAAGLTAAKRDEATRYEPLVSGENQKALAAIPTLDFSAYPFAVILVPGLGPVKLDRPLSEGGQLRCDYAIARYLKKVAPLIAVSGGHVHPDRTPYAEALEMRKYLLSRGIPEAAILVDPHARHTTTNLRNVGRILLRAGIDGPKPILVTTDLGQTLYMSGSGFAARCRNELGYEPWRMFSGLTSTDTCFLPSTLSLQADARDPLDP